MAMQSYQANDRLIRLRLCLVAVSDLTNPEPDLHAVNRDALATLLGFLSEELGESIEQLSVMMRTETDKLKP